MHSFLPKRSCLKSKLKKKKPKKPKKCCMNVCKINSAMFCLNYVLVEIFALNPAGKILWLYSHAFYFKLSFSQLGCCFAFEKSSVEWS